MSIRSVGLLLLLAALAAFVVANWSAFTAPTSLSLLVGTVQAPLGLLMLMITALLGVLFLAYIVWLQTSVLLESRRLNRELAAQRQLADQAEASRFTELRTALDARFDRLEAAARAGTTGDGAAGARARDELRDTIEHAVNGLAAQIAELDDRLTQRGLLPPGR